MNRSTRYARNIALSLVTIAGLYGCGGGGGGSSPTQPPVGTTISGCIKDARNDSAVVGGQFRYTKASSGQDSGWINTDASGCFAATDAHPLSTVDTNTLGYEQRVDVPPSEIAAAGNKIYVVSLDPTFHTRLQETRRVSLHDGSEVGITRWKSPHLGEGLSTIVVKYFNLTNQQVNALARNFHTFSEMTDGLYSLGAPSLASNADFESGVIKIVGEDRVDGGTTRNPMYGAIGSVLLKMPKSYFNSGWEAILRHELGHSSGAPGHATSTGSLMRGDALYPTTNTDELDRVCARVAYRLPVGNKMGPASSNVLASIAAVVEEKPLPPVTEINGVPVENLPEMTWFAKGGKKQVPAEAAPEVRPSRRLIGENRQ